MGLYKPASLRDQDRLASAQVTVLGGTDKALYVRFDETGYCYWIPKSQIHEDSEVYMKGQSGELVIPKWLMHEKEASGGYEPQGGDSYTRVREAAKAKIAKKAAKQNAMRQAAKKLKKLNEEMDNLINGMVGKKQEPQQTRIRRVRRVIL